jgi:hypothetical protein
MTDLERSERSILEHPYVTPVVGAMLVGIGAALVAASGFAIGWLVAIGAWLLVGLALVDRWQRAKRNRAKTPLQQHPTWAGGTWAAIAVALIVVATVVSDDDSREGPERPAPGLRTVTIYNKVTRGPDMAEDPKPLRLFFSPQLCTSPSCTLPGVELRTGNKIDVVCQKEGQEISNGDKSNPADDDNPQLVEDDPIWYGVRTTRDRLVYFSEVWAHPRDRGGLGLTDCSSLAG